MGVYASHGVSVAAFTTGIGPVESLAAQSATTATPAILDAGTVRPSATLVVTTSSGVSAGVVHGRCEFLECSQRLCHHVCGFDHFSGDLGECLRTLFPDV
jgi:hypothetical protein